MKTRIIICVSNRPDLLEKQIQLLNNFMIGEKVVSIVYDTRDKQYESFFKKICDDYNLSYAPGVRQAIDEFVKIHNFNCEIIHNSRFAKIEKI